MKKILIIIVCILLLVFIFWRIKSKFEPSIEIVTSHYKEDLNWLKNSNYKVNVCDKPGADKTDLPLNDSCYVEENKGAEASSYLKYIVNNYDNLADYTVFIHGHEEAWHQKLPFGIIEAIQKAKVENYPYISLNNEVHTIKDGVWEKANKSEKHDEFFLKNNDVWKELESIINLPFPNDLSYDCSAQFILSKECIQQYSKEVYQKLYDFVMSEKEDEWQYPKSRAFVMERIWKYLFTKNPNETEEDVLSRFSI
jgi:hypothetical protein